MAAKYRADHVGSLQQPQELLQACGQGAADKQKLRLLEEQHIQRVLQRQKELGLRIFTDGEFRRSNFMSDFSESVEGIEEGVTIPRSWQAGGGTAPIKALSVPGLVVGKIKLTEDDQWRKLKLVVDTAAKVCGHT